MKKNSHFQSLYQNEFKNFMHKLIIILCILLWPNLTTAVDITLSSETLQFGETIAITIKSKQRIKTHSITFGKKPFKLFLNNYKNNHYIYVTYVAISRHTKPGSTYLKIGLTFKNKTKFFKQYNIALEFPDKPKEGKVTLTKKAKSISNNKLSYQKEGALLSKHFKKITKRRYFDGLFDYPAFGRMSSGFGKLRRYNNGRSSSHAGVDIANKKGTPIYAPQHGKVILSKQLEIHGNTIMIDHGYGIISIYCHLEKRSIKKGKHIKKGTQIGEMGMTGVASGVHLHWGLSVQNVRVDPLFWTQESNEKI